MLQTIQSDVQALKNEGRQGTAGTQTISEQGTQTGLKLFPEGDSVRNSRHGRLRDLMDEVDSPGLSFNPLCCFISLTSIKMLRSRSAREPRDPVERQTGLKLFPEGDSVRNSRHGRLRDLMDEVKNIKGNTPDSPNDMRSRQSSRTGTPYERRPMSGTSVPNRTSPVRFSTPGPVNGHIQNGIPQQNGYDYPQQPYMRTLPVPPFS
jgi:hypothetical protein